MTPPPTPTGEQRLATRNRPVGRPVMEHTWDRLLFLHWRYPAEQVQSWLPRGLFVDTFDGDAWVGIVPFFMRNIRVRGLPGIPGTANFLETNLRTYVFDEQGTPGVWFFSLDANSRLAVHGARAWYRLPYWSATMSADVDESTGRVNYRWQRRGTPKESGSQFVYTPQGEFRTAQAGTLEFFLVERYVLFSEVKPGAIWAGRVAHPPYRLADAIVSDWNDHLLGVNGFERPRRDPDHAAIAGGVTVDVFPLRPVGRRSQPVRP